jgi:DNA-binding MarR family transcriptional regulator
VTEEGDGTPLVVLLRRALSLYGREIRGRLSDQGISDVPRSGSWVLGALAEGELGPQELARRLGGSKQGLSRLSQTLVDRGYASRIPDPSDRRRVLLQLTPRGREAAALVRLAVRGQDLRMARLLGGSTLDRLRRQLARME